VQKFSIPASGNKTKLLNLVLSIFQSLRYERVLIDILQEINKLLAQQRDPFTNPLASIGQLELAQWDPDFVCPPNPVYSESESQVIFGPIYVPEGSNAGQFKFFALSRSDPVNICFLFPNGQPQKFGLEFELNGFPFQISIDDPFPQPLDVTHVLNYGVVENLLNIKMVVCQTKMMICVCEYRYNGLHMVVNQICGRPVNVATDKIFVGSRTCEHQNGFPLVPWLSQAYATGNWNCPVCRRSLDLNSLYVKTEVESAQPTVDIFQPSSDPFSGSFEWDF
jgi:hypothetical protein